ncbi:MAG TPA: FtsX-like permease family protein, partial [Usitatibacter sp.]|nr:FtsX-like permease family protein [Usitatibacter sp.]
SAGELRVLLLALFIAVASVTTVGFFADRVQAALDQQANELLGGDLVVIGDKPLPTEFAADAKRDGLAVAQTRTFPSMVTAEGGVNLAEIKSVTTGFPLRGRLRVVEAMDGPEHEVEGGPKPGTVWIGVALVGRIGARIGDMLKVGKADLRVAAIITREPDSVLDYFGIAPRVLMNEADLESTGLLQVGSRVGYRLLVAGDANSVQRFRDETTPKLGRGQRIEGVRDARSEVRTALDRSQRFLGLASLLSVVLASVAVALAARRFSQRQIDAAAMMRCLGATQAKLFAIHAYQFVALGLAACAIGGAAGYLAQGVLASWLSSFFTVTLPLPGPLPGLRGVAIGFVLLLGFTLPPLLRLRNASTLRVLRRDLAPAEPLTAAAFALGLAALSGLILWQAGDLRLGGIALGGFAAALAVSAIAGYALIRLVARMRRAASGPWRYGLANLRRRTGASLVQIMALGLGLMAMLMLTLVRTEIITKWQESMPPNMPNRFAINIQSDQLKAVKARFDALHLETPDLYPMVRGRLLSIGDRNVSAGAFTDERAKRLVEREFNLSWAQRARPDNRIVAGRFWAPDSKEPEFSVEEGLAKMLGIHVGDVLAFDVAGSKFAAKVTSLRKVDWDSFKPNFYVIASPGLLESYPASWITSFHLPAGRDDVITGLVREFPNVSVIDLSAIISQFQRITEEVSRAVQFVFLFAIAAGLVVLFAAITSTQDERLFEGAILRTLGANRRQLATMQLAEFLTIGLLAGTIASAGAVALAMVLSDRVLGVPYEFHWKLPLIGLFAGGFGVALAGLIGTRRVVDSPPLQTIRAVT